MLARGEKPDRLLAMAEHYANLQRLLIFVLGLAVGLLSFAFIAHNAAVPTSQLVYNKCLPSTACNRGALPYWY
jgi:hypothetical protein